MPRTALSTGTHAVVAVYRDSVLWIETRPRAGLAWAAAPLESDALASVVAAVLAARTQAGGVARDVALALGPGWVGLRFLACPELGTKELRAVFERKAKVHFGTGASDVLFAASAAQDAAPVRGAPRRWLLAAAERARLEALRDELARERLQVRRIVAARLATLAHGGSEGVGLVAQCDPDGVALSLRAQSTLLQQGALEPGTGSSLATTLFQEAQSHAAFARRTLRGDMVGELVLLGFPAEEGAALEPHLGAGLGLARTRRADGGDALAAALFEGALASGPWTLDLLAERRPRPRRAALLSGAALVLALSLAALTEHELDRQRTELGLELRELQRQMGAEERALGAPNGLSARLETLERNVERAEAERARGRAFGDELALVGGAVRGDARIDAFELDADGLRLEGVTDPRPLVALAALERIRRRLAPRYPAIEVAARGSGAPCERFVLTARRAP
ncbi:MAG: hypothetical protein IPJ77_12280 [Planctomycetes bacterium]|nr:hypothetical protein [Planctomycetota bacterium]